MRAATAASCIGSIAQTKKRKCILFPAINLFVHSGFIVLNAVAVKIAEECFNVRPTLHYARASKSGEEKEEINANGVMSHPS